MVFPMLTGKPQIVSFDYIFHVYTRMCKVDIL
jgi:hypothetical protein